MPIGLLQLVLVLSNGDPSYGWQRSVLHALWLGPYYFPPSVRCFFNGKYNGRGSGR